MDKNNQKKIHLNKSNDFIVLLIEPKIMIEQTHGDETMGDIDKLQMDIEFQMLQALTIALCVWILKHSILMRPLKLN